MAEEALRSTSLQANFCRLTRLLMLGGVQLFRETFDSIHSPANLPLRLADPVIQAQLRGARLTRSERNCLYPSPGMYGKSNDFDITLIFKLFRTICSLTPPWTEWMGWFTKLLRPHSGGRFSASEILSKFFLSPFHCGNI